MAITQTVLAPKFAAVFRNIPINLEVTSDQFGSQSFAVTAVANNGGKCEYTVGTHQVISGGVITGSAFSEATYNSRQNVTAVTATTVRTDLDFVSDVTGTITRTNDEFQIRAEIKKGSTIIGEKVAFAITGDVFRVNVANILSAELNFDNFAVGGSDVIIDPTPGSLILYTVKFIEEFNDAAGERKTGQNFTSLVKQALNATRQYLDNQTLDAFVLDSAPNLTGRFLTNAPLTRKIALDEEAQMSFIFDLAGSVRLFWERHTAAGLFDTGSEIETVVDDFRCTAVINDTLFDVATLPNITELRVHLINSIAQTISEERIFKIDRRCYAHPVRFWWLNALGDWDQYTFTGNRKETITTKQVPFNKSLGQSFTIGDRGQGTLAVNARRRQEVWSNFLNAADREWLTELFTSPEIQVQQGSNRVPVVRGSTQVTFINDGVLTQLKISYDLQKPVIQTN